MAFAITYGTGFEAGLYAYYTENAWTINGAASVVNTAGKVHKTASGIGGTYSLFLNSVAGVIVPSVSTTSRWVHQWWLVNNTADGNKDFQFGRAGARQFTVRFIPTTGVIELYRATTLVASSAASAWNPNVAHWVSIFLNAKTVGGCKVYIDNNLVVTFSGNCQEQATADWDQFSYGNGFGGFQFVNGYFDDLIITDDDGGAMTTPLLEAYGVPSSPDSVVSGNLTGVPTTGANRYQNINELPASQVQYNQAAAANDEDLYGLSNPVSATLIYGVIVWAEASRTGGINNAQIRVVSGASDTYSANLPLVASPSFNTVTRILTLNPNGNVVWTGAAVNALQAGIKFTA